MSARASLCGLLALPLFAFGGDQRGQIVAGTNSCKMWVAARPPTRNQSGYYEQVRSSAVPGNPHYILLFQRRLDTTGKVDYSLVAYQPRPSAPVSLIASAVATDRKRAWLASATCSFDEWLRGLDGMLEAIRALPEQDVQTRTRGRGRFQMEDAWPPN